MGNKWLKKNREKNLDTKRSNFFAQLYYYDAQNNIVYLNWSKIRMNDKDHTYAFFKDYGTSSESLIWNVASSCNVDGAHFYHEEGTLLLNAKYPAPYRLHAMDRVVILITLEMADVIMTY
tara:strand:+ start:107 stop:466 length:360 start_codon:yes stop_codon:yes gene_type:complete